MNLFNRWKGGGGTNACICMGTHTGSQLYYRTASWIITKLGMDEVLMVPHMHKYVLAIFAQEQIQGEAK